MATAVKNAKLTSEETSLDIIKPKDISRVEEAREEPRNAEDVKQKGNEAFKNKEYPKALKLYNEAIELNPNSAQYYGNRSACLMMLSRYRHALEDIQMALKLDRNSVKCLIREAKCHIALGDPSAAKHCLQKALEIEPTNSALVNEFKNAEVLQFFIEEGEKSYSKKDYRTVVYCMDRAIQQALDSPHLKLIKAECLVFLGRQEEAQTIANAILCLNPNNADAIYVRGISLYYQENLERAFNHFQQVLRLVPDHTKAREIYRRGKLLKSKKEEGNTAFKKGAYQEAYNIYTAALDIDTNNVFTNAKIYLNRAIVCTKLKKLSQAVEDCNSAIKLDEHYTKAYLRRAKCLMDMEMYEQAIQDYELAYKKESSREIKHLLEFAKRELKRSKRKDYYRILGIQKNASQEEIRRAYRKLALMHHPDRHMDTAEENKLHHEKKFKELGEAYAVLSDPRRQLRYNNGADESDESLFNDMDTNELFETFFPNVRTGFPFDKRKSFDL